MERRRRAARAPHEVPQALHDEPKTGSQSRLLTPGFRAIVVAQVFSLLGIEILQFVLPLHLLNLTGSGTLYGGVVAAGFVPYIALSPVGGVIADRTRKRGVMSALDAVLALIMLGYLACSGSQHLVGITVFVLMVAFAAQAIYHPCVQSALPLVVPTERIPQATAVANQVSMITGIGGPVIGGMVFGFFGLAPIVVVAAVSFAVSSALVLAFVRIPYEPPVRTEGVLRTAAGDIRVALHFLRMRPVLWQIIAAATLINLFGSSFINIGTPYIVTESLGLSNQLMGIAQGALAVGGLLGGALVVFMPERFTVKATPRLVGLAAAGIGAVAVVLLVAGEPYVAFAGMLASYLWVMVCCMAASILMTSYLQMETPDELTGKVMGLAMMFGNLATPAGQIAYGAAFDLASPWFVAALAAVATALVAVPMSRSFRRGE
ncbi:MFS transporter [Enorma massiliensis]|uniref:MFS transporter n=1 Tax=Enorma massiliensis TaxID=1472761 RepID=UPI001959C498|nr:MFS transporter [Enorma massiliensis]MBM6784104.1 MFS transporter [Enorma massiliensis]